MQFMDAVSQPIIAATNLLVIYPPFLGGYYCLNFIQPVYRLSRTPVSDETPFAGLSPAISASQACRQLSQPYRLFANNLLLRLLGRNLSLVAKDSHLDASLSRDLEDAKQSSSVLRGESRPPSSQPGVSSPSKRFAAARLSSQVLRIQKMTLLTLVHLGNSPLLLRLSNQVLRIQEMTLHTLVHLGDGPAIPFAAAAHVQPGPSHPEDDPAYAGPSRRQSYDSHSGSFRHSSRQGSDIPPLKRRRL